MTTILVLMFSLNSYLTFKLDLRIKERIKFAKKKGVSFDSRSKLEVIQEYKKNNKILYPGVYSNVNYIHDFYINDNKIHTLGGISNSDTIICNEGGEWQIYKSDRYGFNNDDDIYDFEKIQIGIVGDSFMQGSCVQRKNTVHSLIRSNFDKTLAIATAGSGSLTNLAFFIEYLSDKKPQILLWFFFSGNDFLEQKQERAKFDILNKYFNESDFKQNLKLLQSDIDQKLIEVVNKENPKNFKSKLRKIVLYFSFEKLFGELTGILFKIGKKKTIKPIVNTHNLDVEFEKEYLIQIL